jgi:glycosyltransferase involved in cell wall biosynthesis
MTGTRKVVNAGRDDTVRPTVLIGITVFNDGQYLDEAIASAVEVRQHTGSATVDIAIHDDQSTDRRTIEILKRAERRGFRVIWGTHGGLGQARNRLLSLPGHQYYVPLDADNRLRRTFVDRLLPLHGPDGFTLASYSDAMRFGNRSGRWVQGVIDAAVLRDHNHVDACSLLNSTALRSLGGYSQTLVAFEDWDLWLRGLEAGFRLEYCPEILFDYRTRPNSMIDQIYRLPAQQHPRPQLARSTISFQADTS